MSNNTVVNNTVLQQSHEYIEYEIDENNKQKVQQLIDNNDKTTLTKLFIPRISFGTAGLRGLMNIGYHNMNNVIIIQTTQGLIKHLFQQHTIDKVQQQGIVIGYDGRHNSKQWADLFTDICIKQNIKVYYFKQPVCTPFVPYYILKVNSICGVMITGEYICYY